MLRAQFLPLSEAQEAISALINIRQQAGESMEKYFQRAALLVARAGTFSDSAAMQIVMDRVRKDEWRCAMAVATRDVQAGKITTLVQLRNCLQREALAEPGKQKQAGSSSSNTPTPYKGSSSAHKHKQAVRAAAAGLAEYEEGSGSDSDAAAPGGASSTKVAAMQKRAGMGKCYRCGEAGHIATACPQPDKRECFACHQKGHIASACPKRAATKNS